MGQNQQQGQRKSKKEKKVVPAPVHKRHAIYMTRERKAKLIITEIRKAERKLAKRRRGSNEKLHNHIANLKVMQERLERGFPAEVRTKRDYAPRYRPIPRSVPLREAMTREPFGSEVLATLPDSDPVPF
jgi:hypothetical protein